MASMRITGWASGMDTEAMIKSLMNAENLKLDKLRQKRQLIEWKQEAYRNMATTLKTFQSSFLQVSGSTTSSIRMPSTFNTLKASVTSSGTTTAGLTARITSATTGGSHTLEVQSAATGDAYLSKTMDARYTGDNKTGDNQTVTLALDKLLVDDGFTVKLDNGPTVTFTLTAADFNGVKGQDGKVDATLLADTINKKLQDRYQYTVDSSGKPTNIQKVSFEFDSNSNSFSFVAGAGHTVTVGKTSDDSSVLQHLGFKDGGTTQFSTSMSLKDAGIYASTNLLEFKINGVAFKFDATDSLEKVMNDINNSSAGVTMSFDSLRSSFKLASNHTGSGAKINFEGNDTFEKFFTDNATGATTLSEASDAVFKYDGVMLSRDTNYFELDGVAYSLSEAAEGKTFEVNLTSDTQPATDAIKKFVEEYNKLIEAINKETGTARARSDSYTYYEPLTSDQKTAMSDKEVELWEEKAKTGMLYRDDILTALNSQLRSMITAAVTLEDGSKISLSNIGITTSNESNYIGKLQIDETKLQKALEENSDAVAQLFTKTSEKSGVSVQDRKSRLLDEGLGDRLNDIIRNAVEFGGSIYDRAGLEGTSSSKNNELQRQLTSQDTRISDMLTYLSKREDYYYRIFANMENAMNQSNNQMSSIQSLLA